MDKTSSNLPPEYLTSSEVPEFSFYREGREVIKSPNTMWQENSEERQDSGYCSLTPISSLTPIYSVTRPNIFNRKCSHCFKTMNISYAQSTPHYDSCSCKKHNSFETSSLQETFLETISEPRSVFGNQFSSGRKQNIPLVLDEAMDSSLYTDEMEVAEFSEGHECNLDSLEISEEQSVDFLDTGTPLTSSTSNTQNFSNEVMVVKENKNDIAKKLFAPESSTSTPEIDSPKYQNETTPTKKGRPAFANAVSKVCLVKKILDLWSFKLCGIEEVDFLYQLGVKKSFPNVISKIFSFLSEKDIDSVRRVSKTWKEAVSRDQATYSRWRNYKRMRKMLVLKGENYFSPVSFISFCNKYFSSSFGGGCWSSSL